MPTAAKPVIKTEIKPKPQAKSLRGADLSLAALEPSQIGVLRRRGGDQGRHPRYSAALTGKTIILIFENLPARGSP